MPPGATTNASEASTKWCRRVKNVRCSKTCSTKALASCSDGRSTRMPMDRSRSGAPASAAPSLAAFMRPCPPPVTMSQPISASARATRRVSSYGNVPGWARAEPKIVTR